MDSDLFFAFGVTIIFIIGLIFTINGVKLKKKRMWVSSLIVSGFLLICFCYAYFVGGPAQIAHDRCTGPAGLDCIDRAYVVDDDLHVMIPIANKLGYSIRFVNTGASGMFDCWNGSILPSNIGFKEKEDKSIKSEIKVLNNQEVFIILKCSTKINTRHFKTDLDISYINLDTQENKRATFAITMVDGLS
jgi:hypothetical protein